jgi:hypothetical protein
MVLETFISLPFDHFTQLLVREYFTVLVAMLALIYIPFKRLEPRACCVISYISVAILPSFQQNLMQKFCSATHPFHSMTVGKTCWHCRKPHSRLCQPAPHSLVRSVKSCCQIFYTAVTSVPLVVNQKILINLHSLLCKCRKKLSIFLNILLFLLL